MLLGAALVLPAAALVALAVFVRRRDVRESRRRAAAPLHGLGLATALTWWAWAGFLSAIGDG